MSAGPSDSQVLGFIRQRMGRHVKWLVPSALFAALTVVAEVQTVFLPQKFIDQALGNKQLSLVVYYAVALVALFVFYGVADFCHRLFLRISVERTVRDVRNEIFDRILVLSHDQASYYTSGKAVNSIVSDVQVTSNGLHIIADLMKEPLTVVGMVGTLIYINWRLTLVCLVAIPLVAAAGKALGRSARRNQGKIQDSMERLSNQVVESLGGLKTAHTFGRTRLLRDEFRATTDHGYRHLVRLARTEELISPSTKIVTAIVGALLIAYGGWLVVRGQLTPGGLVAFITAAAQISQPMRQLNQVGVRLQQVIAASRRIYALLHEPLDEVARGQAQFLTAAALPPAPRKREVLPLVFRDVSYHYPHRTPIEGEGAESADTRDRPWALDNINIELQPGRRLALVGKSGSGKSTLTLAALRFIDVTKGRVLLGDKPATEWDLGEYRAHFSSVSQDIFLFNRSIRDNLAFARGNATDREIWTALEKAQMKDFVEKLPRGLDTELGERASRLSGGERQRLAIARAFLKDAPLVILDEATSNLDATSEKAVSQALYELMEDRSVLIIAHRLSLIREVDEIAVMGDGKLIEFGPPETLLEKADGHFRKLWDTQRGESAT